jgi:hypothetical protein
MDDVVAELRARLAETNGWSGEELDRRAFDDAVDAAGRGDYGPATSLLVENRADPQTLIDAIQRRRA